MPPRLTLGWEEWVALPALGLPAVKAKVDTGARTSALHADDIELFGPAEAPRVRFVVHPVPGRADIAVTCAAPVVGRREVTSSNGEREVRFVIVTEIAIAGHVWPIEVTLTNRETMSYRMLIGRQAIGEDMVIEPNASFRQPRLTYRAYRHLPRRDAVARPLRVALVTQKADGASSQRLAEATAAAGHVLDVIDPRLVTLTFDGTHPGLAIGRQPLGRFDGVITRLPTASPAGVAVLRQLELMGAFVLNPADVMERLGQTVAAWQTLLHAGLVAAPRDLPLDAEARGTLPTVVRGVRLLVVGHKVVAGLGLREGRVRALTGKAPVEARRLARRATRALHLGLAAVDVSLAAEAPEVAAVSPHPSLTRFERLAGVDAAAAVVAAIEAQVRRSAPRRPL